MNRELFSLLLLSLCFTAHAANDKKALTAEERSRIAGKSATTVTHEPRQVTIFGARFLARTEDEKGRAALLLGASSGDILRNHFDAIVGDKPFNVSIPDVEDPARSIATVVQQHLTQMGLVFSDTDSERPLLPATPLRGNFVPDTNVDLLVAAVDTDLALDVQTYSWQISRNTVFTGVWFTYISRMTLADKRDKTVLLERDCVSFARHSKSEVSSLADYLENDKAMLKKDLLDAAEHCKVNFLASLRAQ